MVEEQHSADNPYRAPSSNLTHEADEWSTFRIMCGERYWRSWIVGCNSATVILLLSKVGMDTIIFGGNGDSSSSNMALNFLIVMLVQLALAIPISKLTLYLHRRTQTPKRFYEKQSKSMRRWYNQPIPLLVLIMSIIVTVVFGVEVLYAHVSPVSAWIPMQTLSFVAIPLVTPIAYFPLRSGSRSAEEWLNRIPKDA